MSYIPTNWQNGDIITAEKMNKIEEGIAFADNSFPIITADDDGAALVVKKIPIRGNIIVPEQTINYNGTNYVKIIPQNIEEFTLGTIVLFTVNGETVQTVVQTSYDSQGFSYWALNKDCMIMYDPQVNHELSENALIFIADNAGDYTIEVCVVDRYSYEYRLDPYPGYDAVFMLNNNDLIHATEVEIIKGNYVDLRDKAENKKPLSFLVCGNRTEYWSTDNTYHKYLTTFNVLRGFLDAYTAPSEEPYFYISISQLNFLSRKYTAVSSGGSVTYPTFILAAGNNIQDVRNIKLENGNKCTLI